MSASKSIKAETKVSTNSDQEPIASSEEKEWKYKVTVRLPRTSTASKPIRRPVLMGVRFKALMNRKGAIVQFVTKKAAIRSCKNGHKIAPGHVLTKLDGFSTLTLDLTTIVEKFNQHTLTRRPFVLNFVTDMTKISTKNKSIRRRAATRRRLASSKAMQATPYRPRSGKFVKVAELVRSADKPAERPTNAAPSPAPATPVSAKKKQ